MLITAVLGLGFPSLGAAQALEQLVGAQSSELAAVVERYSTDRTALGRRWSVPYSPERNRRFHDFFSDWRRRIDALDFETLSLEGRVDYVLLINDLTYQLDLIEREARLAAEMNGFIPFASLIVELEERRRRREPVESEAAAARLAALPAEVAATRETVEARLESEADLSRIVALRAVTTLAQTHASARGLVRALRRLRPRLHMVERGPVRPRQDRARRLRDVPARDGDRIPRGRGRTDRRRSDRGGRVWLRTCVAR